eukprot:PhF_6_TR41622/c0_g1_i1/m.63083/K02734/PSMB2; 20S proteasome subunit beta 4
MAENLIAIAFKDFVLLAASGQENFYFMQLHNKADKLYELDPFKILGVVGENAPRVNFVEFVQRNLDLATLRSNGRRGTTHATAHYVRNELAKALRSRNGAYECSIVLAGFDTPSSEFDKSEPAPSLYFLDYLGTLEKVPYACHGYGATFSMAILDRYYRADMTEAEGVALLKQCMEEIRKRIIINNEYFVVKTLSKDGVKKITTVS